MTDNPIRRLDWSKSDPDVDYRPAAPPVESAPKDAPPAEPARTKPTREWEAREIVGSRQESVQLPLELTAKLKWMIPGPRESMSVEAMHAKRELLAKAGIFDSSPHAYMARILSEAIQRDFECVDEIWRGGGTK